jgi:hypothetical protein
VSSATLAVGTSKGLFLFEQGSTGWSLQPPRLSGWETSAVYLDPAPGKPLRILAGTVHWSYGATIRESTDGGETWTQLEGRPAYPEGSPYKLNRIWQLADARLPDTLYAGIDEAALFVSRDNARTWTELSGLTSLPSRKDWNAGGGGLCLHTILIDQANPRRIWVGISSVGVFRSDDAGETWVQKTDGIDPIPGAPTTAFCIHKIVQHPTRPDTLFMQFHGGVYVSRDGAEHWSRIEDGLPGNFGFPITITPRGTLIIAPLKSDEQRVFSEGRFAIYRSTDEGASWKPVTKGLPAEPTFSGILRDAMTTSADGQIFFGTTNGEVWTSNDDGESWSKLPALLPRVLMVRAV